MPGNRKHYDIIVCTYFEILNLRCMQLSNDKGKDHAKVSNELSHYLLFNYTLSNMNKLSIISLNKLLNLCTYSID